MNNSRSLGKYVNGDSIIHKMDPRVKLFVNILLIVLVFLTKFLFIQMILLSTIITAFLFSSLSKTILWKSLKPVITIGIFILILNFLLLDPSDTWLKLWKFNFSPYAFELAALIMFRIYTMILTTTLLTSTTSSMELTRAIEDILSPLKIFRIRVNIIALIISIALRFIPTLLEETQKIMKAQASRGVDFKSGNIKMKVKALVTLIIPLFVSAFSKAEDLAYAMEIRGYDPYEKRTRYRRFIPKFYDYLILLLFLSLMTFIILTNTGVINLPWWMLEIKMQG